VMYRGACQSERGAGEGGGCMETLWAPWRMTYIEKARPSTCLFCDAPLTGDDERDLVLYRGKSVFILMNLYPYNPGHLMIAPYRHLDDLERLSPDELLELVQEAARSTRLLRDAMNPDGFNLGVNLGKVAGAGIEDHLHLHIVPRWNGDTNFMPVVAGARVVPEHPAATYRKLASLFRSA
jgi:ATP adenylyltransferase